MKTFRLVLFAILVGYVLSLSPTTGTGSAGAGLPGDLNPGSAAAVLADTILGTIDSDFSSGPPNIHGGLPIVPLTQGDAFALANAFDESNGGFTGLVRGYECISLGDGACSDIKGTQLAFNAEGSSAGGSGGGGAPGQPQMFWAAPGSPSGGGDGGTPRGGHTPEVQSVPDPSTLLLLGTGLVTMAAISLAHRWRLQRARVSVPRRRG